MPSRRTFLAGLGGVGLLGVAGCLGYPESVFSAGSDGDADWPAARFDAENSAYSPDATAPRTAAAETWAVEVGRPGGTPAVVAGTVYQPAWNALVAIDAATGEERWRFAPTDHFAASSPTVHDGVVYVGDGDTLYALDATTGEERWRVDGAIGRAPPMLPSEEIVSDPPLVVGNEDGVVRGLDPRSGEERWRVDVFGAVRTLAWRLHGPYVGTWGGEVYAFYDDGTGPRGVWRTKVGGPVESLTPTSNGLYVQTFGGPLTALAEDNAGTLVRTVDAKHASTAAVHAGSWLYSGGYDDLSSVREYDGNVHWRVGGRYDFAAPVAAGDRLYAASESGIHAFDLDGGVGGGTTSFDVKRWSYDLPGVQGMAVADGALFVAVARESAGASLYRLDEA